MKCDEVVDLTPSRNNSETCWARFDKGATVAHRAVQLCAKLSDATICSFEMITCRASSRSESHGHLHMHDAENQGFDASGESVVCQRLTVTVTERGHRGQKHNEKDEIQELVARFKALNVCASCHQCYNRADRDESLPSAALASAVLWQSSPVCVA